MTCSAPQSAAQAPPLLVTTAPPEDLLTHKADTAISPSPH